MLDLLKPWLTPDGVLLAITIVGLLVSLFKGHAAAQKFKQTSTLLTTVIQGVESYRNANPEQKAAIRDEIQSIADQAGVEADLQKVVKSVTEPK